MRRRMTKREALQRRGLTPQELREWTAFYDRWDELVRLRERKRMLLGRKVNFRAVVLSGR